VSLSSEQTIKIVIFVTGSRGEDKNKNVTKLACNLTVNHDVKIAYKFPSPPKSHNPLSMNQSCWTKEDSVTIEWVESIRYNYHCCKVSKLPSNMAPFPASCWLRFHVMSCSSRNIDCSVVKCWHVSWCWSASFWITHYLRSWRRMRKVSLSSEKLCTKLHHCNYLT